jgi:2-polyprenyl-3-methyl-5-hydroxy-6-metoxy-1,4-benzoquinol methylase
MMRDLQCTLCGSGEFTVRYPSQLEDAENAFNYLTEKPCHYRIVDCANCGMTYSTPIFDEKKIIELYRTCSTEEAQGAAEEQAILVNMRRYLERLRCDSGIASGRLLDIGCGLGHLVAEARQMGYDAVGVDPSEQAIAEARRRSGPDSAICGTYSESLFPSGHFDLITLVHVIDHVVTPIEMLRAMHGHLRPGGHAFIATHNIGSLLAKLTGKGFIAWSVQHISYYTPATLAGSARAAGLEPVSQRGSLTTYPLVHFAKNGLRNETLRGAVLGGLAALSLSDLQLSFPFGNIELICAKRTA